MTTKKKILYLDDDKSWRESIVSLLEKKYNIRAVGSEKELLAVLIRDKWIPDVFLIDWLVPTLDSPKKTTDNLLRKLRKQFPNVPRIVLTLGKGDLGTASRIKELECGYVEKTISGVEDLAKLIKKPSIADRQVLDSIESSKRVVEVQLHQKNRILSFLGSATFIHEFSSPLDLIGMNAKLIREKGAKISFLNHIDRQLELIIGSTNYGRKLIEVIRKVATNQKNPIEPVFLCQFVSRFIDEIPKYILIPKSITIKKELLVDDLQVIADENFLHVILLNLIKNAIEAMKESGTISMIVGEQNGDVFFSINDSGPGIDEKIMSKIFDPLYSTKEKGEFTGCGLFICKNLVELQGGTIEAQNLDYDGGGASVRVYFRKFDIS